MPLRDWIASFPLRATATTATTATEQGKEGELSQVSQLSQGVQGERAKRERPELSQLSQKSKPFGGSPVRPDYDADDAREAFEERAAIMEFDGELTRAEAEALAAVPVARQSGPSMAATDQSLRWRGEGLDLGDLRPCLWCRNLTRSGRCMAAWRGELRVARDWGPTFPDQPQRCIGYSPQADDPDQRPGRERWPEMITWQARLTSQAQVTSSDL
jgi:hypothetical protein